MSETKSNALFFPRSIWLVFVVCAGLATWLNISQAMGDRGLTNVMTFGLFLISAGIAGIWFVFFSRLGLMSRFLTTTTVMGLIAVFFSLFRIDSVDGEMIPHIVWRRSGTLDHALEVPLASAGIGIDLRSTGAWDFPQFLGPHRDGSLTVPGLERDWESHPPELAWRQPIGAGWSGFAVVNGYAVTQEQRGELELVTCYELETGKLQWSHSTETRYDNLLAGPGPRATPSIDDGRVYALTSNGILLALDGSSGELIWEHNLPAEYGLSPEDEAANVIYGRANSPLVAGPLVIIPAGGNPAGRLVSLVAFDKETGAKMWEGGNRQISYSSPAVATLAGIEQVLILNEASVSGHSLETGKVLFEFTRPGVTSADPNVSQAVPLPPNRVFVSKGYGIGAALLQLEPGPDGTLAVEEVWSSFRVLRTKFTNVTIHEGHVYGLSDGILECVELETGRRVWKAGRYHQGQLLRAHDLLIVLSEEGEVVLVEASPEHENNVLGRFQALLGKTWNNFACYGEFLLVRNGEEAAAYRLPPTK